MGEMKTSTITSELLRMAVRAPPHAENKAPAASAPCCPPSFHPEGPAVRGAEFSLARAQVPPASRPVCTGRWGGVGRALMALARAGLGTDELSAQRLRTPRAWAPPLRT